MAIPAPPHSQVPAIAPSRGHAKLAEQLQPFEDLHQLRHSKAETIPIEANDSDSLKVFQWTSLISDLIDLVVS